MNDMKLLVFFGTISILTNFFVFSNAYAYIDAGSGSVIITMIISAIVGIGITIRMYWEKLKYKLTAKKQEKTD